ncbi:arylacetamide deacetylase-like 4 [Pantherophis guttatus]|uniref:Arylacetamide deacetylase-like 4 n=1 Tax=Pantherophis guttatus TaxID=94885 RepID=A0ABM3YX95_PANGU|nr:arylacetamide deacetylase-like 4 [Pantherophis guttatus]
MTSFWKHLACLLVGTAVYPAIFLVSVVIQYSQTVFPPGIDQALQLRMCQVWLLSGILFGIVAEALGLSSLPEIIRLWTNTISLFKDPSLTIRDQDFDGVPVRIYSPKTEPKAKGKAVLFCHGGAGIAGSIGIDLGRRTLIQLSTMTV